ncbi:MAG TPA: malto-oligosyltrehalose trehalohydrolase [Candidatus Acidoferrales bacterium]|nr:malto-oligosyltrehalose trehalohydrolase [Candidatus Acidoferrales bacterium]
MMLDYELTWGADVRDDGVRFRLWAPAASSVGAVLIGGGGERIVPMDYTGEGWYEAARVDARAGARYLFEIDGKDRVPDPAARFAPEGPHGPSEIVDLAKFRSGKPPVRTPAFEHLVFYELHVGTFTPSGTYAELETRLDYLADLGINAIELMPLAEWPGERNWGYDGVLYYAPAHRYGRPEQLRALIDAAHERGIAMFLDVVYNHFGPQDNYLRRYAPQFFTHDRTTPWGDAIDYSSPHNDAVRSFVVDNAVYWLRDYGFDGLRLDATQAIFDARKPHVLEALALNAKSDGSRTTYLVLENDENDVSILTSGYDAQWNDDTHHCLHVALTGEHDGYYQDYAEDPVGLLGRALTHGFAYQGERSAFREGRTRGSPSGGLDLSCFVNCLQNHDQIGNRAFGDRITAIAKPEAVRAATAVLLLAPSPPLLFMGEEWGASSPFLFFCDFEPSLAKLVTEGRRNEFARFARFSDPRLRAKIPDPSSEETFLRSKLDWDERSREPHRELLALHRRLLQIRRAEIVPCIHALSGRDAWYEMRGKRALFARWIHDDLKGLVLEANLADEPQTGFAERARGRVLYATHETFPGDLAPGWSVRWSIE